MSDPHEGLAAWLRLTLVPGLGPEGQRALLTANGLPEAIFAAGPRAAVAVVGEKLATALFASANEAAIENALKWAEMSGNAIVTLADPQYPTALLQTADPPSLLYVKGRVELLSRPSIAIVGSRSATAQGLANAEAFAKSLAQGGLAVVSGLALGIDAAAHRGGLEGEGGTIAFIGTGADRIYPARNASLARRIAEEGAIVSEFPLGMPPLQHNFPRRNRLIAGVARGVLVVEAALKSGSLITARLAGEIGREVFALPGSIHSPLSKGCHQLIKQGAKLVDDARDILEEFAWGRAAPAVATAPVAGVPLPEGGAVVLTAMGFDPVDADTMCTRSSLTPEVLFDILLSLELEGRVARLPGGRFQRLP